MILRPRFAPVLALALAVSACVGQREGERARAALAPDAPSKRCHVGAERISSLVCEAAHHVAEARRRRDVVRFVCGDEKLEALHGLAVIRHEAVTRLSGEPSPTPAEAHHLGELVRITEQRMWREWDDARTVCGLDLGPEARRGSGAFGLE